MKCCLLEGKRQSITDILNYAEPRTKINFNQILKKNWFISIKL